MAVQLAGLLNLATGADILLPAVAPYKWNNGDHDIPMTKAFIPIIGMAYVHHGAVPAVVTDARLADLEAAALAEGATDDDVASHENAVIIRAVGQSMAQLTNWYMILVACQQVKELKASNLENFAKMCRCQVLPQKASAYIAYWAASQEDFAGNEDVRELFAGNRFFEYHTTGSATPMLCQDAIEEVNGLGIFTNEEVGAVRDAVEAYYDLESARGINSTTVVKSSAVLEASGRLPDNWWMGKKAVARYSSKRYSSLVKHLKRIFDIQMNTDNLEEMDLPGLVTSLKKLLSNTQALPGIAPDQGEAGGRPVVGEELDDQQAGGDGDAPEVGGNDGLAGDGVAAGGDLPGNRGAWGGGMNN